MEMACSLLDSTPLREDVHALYDPPKERIQKRNFLLDLRLRKLLVYLRITQNIRERMETSAHLPIGQSAFYRFLLSVPISTTNFRQFAEDFRLLLPGVHFVPCRIRLPVVLV